MNMREVIWAVSFDSLLEPDPYIVVEDVMGHVSPIYVVEKDISLF